MKKRKKNKKNQRRGFTLIEILVVSTIAVVISAIGLVSFSSAAVGARDAQRSKDLDNVRTTLLLFRSENGYYPIAGLEVESRITFSYPRRIMARLASSLVIKEARAISVDPIGFTPPPIDDSISTPLPTFIIRTPTPTPTPTATIEIIRQTPTPTPKAGCYYQEVNCIQAPCDPVLVCPTPTPTTIVGTPVPTATVSAGTPTPTPDPDAVPEGKSAYDVMVISLVNGGYYVEDDIPHDPVNDNTYYYGYDSDVGQEFTLTARLEKDSTVITLTD